MPYRTVFDVVWSGRRHVMMMASQIDRTGNQNLSAIGDWARPKAQLVGVRGAPGNSVNHPTSYWVPDHSRAHLRRAGRRGLRASATPGPPRPGPAATRFHDDPPRGLEPRRLRLRDARPHHAAALAPPRRDRRRGRARPPGSRWPCPTTCAETRLPDARGARAHPRSCSTRGSLRDREVTDAERAMAGRRCTRRSHTAFCRARSASAIPIVQTGMGWVSGPRPDRGHAPRGGWASWPRRR